MKFALPLSLLSLATTALSQLNITSITHGGTGCRVGTVSTKLHQLANDKSGLSLIFTNYNISISPQLPKTTTRANCQISINLSHPPNFYYRISDGGVTFNGTRELGVGVTATLKNTFYFSGEAAQASYEETIKGPAEGAFSSVFSDPFGDTLWSKCGMTTDSLYINSQAQLTSTDPAGMGTFKVEELGQPDGLLISFDMIPCKE